MGYAKYFEDNERITRERIYEREITELNVLNKIYYDCYYCNKSFESSEKRNIHIKKEHNVVGPLLIINGKISYEEYYVDEIKTAKIVLCGFNEITILINQEKIDHGGEDIDLKPYFLTDWNISTICIGQKKYKINKFSSENISNKIVNEIIDTWENQISENVQKQISNNYPNNLNEAEKQYLNGFYDYFTACKATDETNKKNRYEDALAQLSSFNQLPPKAIVLLKVIAFRFNWIERLENLSKDTNGSQFDTIVSFYNEEKTTKKEITRKKENEQKIYVEDEIADCIDAIIAYQNENYSEVEKYIKNWTELNIANISDTNKKDRIFLLKARMMNILEKYSDAKAYYDAIKSPFLKKEAEKYSKR